MGKMSNKGEQSDSLEMEKRVYKVSLMLRRKPISAVIQFITSEWDVTVRQAYNYIKLAKEEWRAYFEHLKHSGMGYYVAQLRDLKDQAYRKKVVIGIGKDKKVVKTPNLGLVFDITKEEAKLMGTYPAEKHDVTVITDFAKWIKKTKETKDKGKAKGKAKSKAYNETTRRVPEEGIEDSKQIDKGKEEGKTPNKISRRVPDNSKDEGERTDEVEEDFKV